MARDNFSRAEGSCSSTVRLRRPVLREFLSMIAVQITAGRTNTGVREQQSHLCFPAWEACCSKLCGLGLSLVFQEAFRAIKPLVITPQLFAPWLRFCLCCRRAACLCINCLEHTWDTTKMHLPRSPPRTTLRQGEEKPAALGPQSREAEGISFLLNLSFSRYQNTL